MKGIFIERLRGRKHYACSCGSYQALIRLHLRGLVQAEREYPIHISELGLGFLDWARRYLQISQWLSGGRLKKPAPNHWFIFSRPTVSCR